jgi:CrcB protein
VTDHLPDEADERVVRAATGPDIRAVENAGHSTVSPFTTDGRARWPQFRADVVGVVFAGGCLGGWLRYAVTTVWAAPALQFPWSTLAVNLAGAFILPLVVVIAADIAPSRYLRPLAGTGFCGALTTFSSVVVVADQLIAHHHASTAVAYLAATIVGASTAAALGLVLGKVIATSRRRQDRSEQ